MEHNQSSPLWRRSATAAACAAVIGVGAAVAPAVAGVAFNFDNDLRDFAPAAAGPFDGARAKLTLVTDDATKAVFVVHGVDPSVAGQTFGAHLHVGPCVAGNGPAALGHYNHSGTTPADGQRPDRGLAGRDHQRRGQRPERGERRLGAGGGDALGGHPREPDRRGRNCRGQARVPAR